MNSNLFASFDDVLAALQAAATVDAVEALINQVDQEFEASRLDVNPAQWGHLASAVLIRTNELRKHPVKLEQP